MSASFVERRAAIEAEILAWMREPEAIRDEARFEALALRLFVHQYEACEPYRRYCDALGRGPGAVDRVEAIAAVPTGAFKEFALRGFPEAATILTFRTSGTSTERRGELHLDTLALYEASLLASLRRCFLTDLGGTKPTMRSRPVRRLKGFAKISLKAGETQRVTIALPASSLGFHDDKGRYAVEPGEFQLFVGGDSRAELTTSFHVDP